MEWEIHYRKRAYEYLLANHLISEVESRLHLFLTNQKVDIVKLKGKWNGFYRLRLRDSRVLFSLDSQNKIIDITHAGS